jgi:hypothetical protein
MGIYTDGVPEHRFVNLRVLLRHPRWFARIYAIPLLILSIGMALDGASTLDIVLKYGSEVELHPAMHYAIEVAGPALGVVLGSLAKMAFVLLVSSLKRSWMRWLPVLCGFLYIMAAVSNFFRWL